MIKKGIWAVGLFAIAAAIAYAALPFIASTQIVRDRIAIEMSAWSGYRVELGGAPDIEVWPFRAILTNVTLSGWSDPERKPVIVAERVEIELSALAALRGYIVFSSTRLIRPTVRVAPVGGELLLPVSPSGGRIARSIEAARIAVSANPSNPELSGIPSDPFGKVEFVDGRIVVQRDGKDEEIVTSLAGAVNWAALDRSGTLAATGIWRGESVALDMTMAKPLVLFAGGTAPLSVSLKAAPVSLTFEGSANLSRDTYFEGPLSFSTPSLKRMLEWSTEQATPGPAIGSIAIKGTITGNSQRMRFADAEVTLDGNPGMGVLELSFTEAIPALSGTLAFDALDIRSFLTAFTPLDSGNGAVDGIDMAFADRINLDLRLSAAKANAGSATLIDVAATAQIKPGLAAFDISDGSAFGGSIQTGIRFDRQPGANQVELRLLATDIDGGILAAASKSARVVPTGRGTVSIILKGPGKSWNELLQKGDGSVTASFGQGALSNLDLNALVERMKQGGFFALSEVSKGSLPINSFELKASVSKGVARVEKAEVKAPAHTITLSGIVPYVGGGLALSGTIHPLAQEGANPPPADSIFFVGGSLSEPFIAPIYQNVPPQPAE
jgi:AsmA protein